jgi:hypothetical protein
MPDYGSGGEGSSPSGSAQRPVAHLAERRFHAAEAAGSRPAGPTGAWTQKARGPAVTRVLAGAVPARHPIGARHRPREVRELRHLLGELIMWREHPAVNRSLRLCRFDSCLAHRCLAHRPRPHRDGALLPGSGICRRASEARSSQFDSGQGDARRHGAVPAGRVAACKAVSTTGIRLPAASPARSTKDVRLPPKQMGASSSLAGPTLVFRCGTPEETSERSRHSRIIRHAGSGP